MLSLEVPPATPKPYLVVTD